MNLRKQVNSESSNAVSKAKWISRRSRAVKKKSSPHAVSQSSYCVPVTAMVDAVDMNDELREYKAAHGLPSPACGKYLYVEIEIEKAFKNRISHMTMSLP